MIPTWGIRGKAVSDIIVARWNTWRESGADPDSEMTGEEKPFRPPWRRSNRIDAGRHSLGTEDRDRALRNLTRVNLNVVVKHGLAVISALKGREDEYHSLTEGRSNYTLTMTVELASSVVLVPFQ